MRGNRSSARVQFINHPATEWALRPGSLRLRCRQTDPYLFGAIGVPSKCNYSLELVASRPAKVGDKLVSTSFPHTITRGFASVDEPNVAVCLLPGTELAFDREVQCRTGSLDFYRRFGHRVAKFQEVNKDRPNVHHDAPEFPDGTIVLLTHLCQGQRATVLQLPAQDHVTLDHTQRSESLLV